MCLIAFAWRPGHVQPLLVVAHRDEFRARPTAPLDLWPEPQCVAGRDLSAGGTWLALGADGRFAALTNIRRAPAGKNLRSRGTWPIRALSMSHADLCAALVAQSNAYGPFNLIWGDPGQLYAFHCELGFTSVSPGVHALSNAALDTPWPKVVRARQALVDALGAQELTLARASALLRDVAPAPDNALPDTGVGLAWERRLSSMLIPGPDYGTRSVTTMIWRGERAGEYQVEGSEQTLQADAEVSSVQHFLLRDAGFRIADPELAQPADAS